MVRARRRYQSVRTNDERGVMEEIMQRYCDGDSSAFDDLYQKASPRLLSYLISLASERPAAEDLLQETFLKIHNARYAYVRGADPMPWFYAIARRTFLDHARRNRRARVRLHDGDRLPEVEARLDGMRMDVEPEQRTDPQLKAAVLTALEQLPPNQREAIRLTKLDGLSPMRAAAAIGVTVGAIKLRAHRAIANLKQILSTGDEETEAMLDQVLPAPAKIASM
jgi:RNA polymerase sigma-70 factor (ECF subfamily)